MSMSSEGSENLPEDSSNFVLLWSREREKRGYSMVNADTGVFYAHEQECQGHRVLCMTRVENRTWLGTEVNLDRREDRLFVSNSIVTLMKRQKQFQTFIEICVLFYSS